MDAITLQGVSFYGYHGVLAHEKERGQLFCFDCTYRLDASCCEDDLQHTVSYGSVATALAEFGASTRFDLLETLAHEAAGHLLETFSGIESLDLTIHKPRAPIRTAFTDVSLRVERGWHRVYLGLGSNLGDRAAHLKMAQDYFKDLPKVRDVRCAPVYETAPYGVLDQPRFLNTALSLSTYLTPKEVLHHARHVEQRAQRKRERRWGARTLDVDLLLYGDWVFEEEDLIVPHPELSLRDFVLIPLLALNPYLRDPRTKERLKDLTVVRESALRLQNKDPKELIP
ncbi:2-amino-4-hydroxy-6- hydroxymethyldihydropteridine pyrophosphokinase [Clostridiaceae bacterium JG1575]|nr:2-amino-4-hydroxy-6- hydroxymethyldihydropteridine pyrophosphokinase [Clostridiaceae bacterium JG1575]